MLNNPITNATLAVTVRQNTLLKVGVEFLLTMLIKLRLFACAYSTLYLKLKEHISIQSLIAPCDNKYTIKIEKGIRVPQIKIAAGFNDKFLI
jgi:hypothetical protein